jgi:hypothetical protein
MRNYLFSVFLFFPTLIFSQNIKITFIDKLDKKPINGIQIFSENGSIIGNSNSKGEFELDKSILKESGFKNLMVYNDNYLSVEYNIDEIPQIISLEKIKSYELEPVVIIKKLSEKYYTIRGYFRSWQLVNNKLVKYGDGLIEYHIPYKNSNNDFDTGIKKYITEYRTFKIDSIKQKSRIISISSFDSYLDCQIPKRDILARGWKQYKTKLTKDNLHSIFEGEKNVGYVKYDKNNNADEINISESFEDSDAVKFLFWKFSASYTNTEKWTGEDEFRHLNYSFISEKKIVKSKEKNNAVETNNEIFIDNNLIYNDKIPEKSKTYIDKDRSFYTSKYWDEQIKKHPLPSIINRQLLNVNENKNNYK